MTPSFSFLILNIDDVTVDDVIESIFSRNHLKSDTTSCLLTLIKDLVIICGVTQVIQVSDEHLSDDDFFHFA